MVSGSINPSKKERSAHTGHWRPSCSWKCGKIKQKVQTSTRNTHRQPIRHLLLANFFIVCTFFCDMLGFYLMITTAVITAFMVTAGMAFAMIVIVVVTLNIRVICQIASQECFNSRICIATDTTK